MENIDSTEKLWRRVFFKDPNYVKEDGTVTSLAFKPRQQDNNKLSVDRATLATYDKSIQDAERFRLGELSAKVPIEDLVMSVIADPLPDNEAHALICSEDFSKAVCRTLAANTVLLAHQK
jgi:hypothetical protein